MAIRRDRDGRIQPTLNSADTPPTRPLKRPAPSAPEPACEPPTRYSLPDEHTQMVTPGAPTSAGLEDLVVGWLVIVTGPGRGRAFSLGYGMNSISRGAKARVRLDFGDRGISRDSHAILTYDPRSRRFYLQHGGGAHLAYLNEQPVLMPTELTGGEIIMLGQTRLYFVPFCGAKFDWQTPER